MVFIVGALAWEFPISLPLFARQVLHGGAGTYGAMTAVMGAGAVVGGLITASRPEGPPRWPGHLGHRLGGHDHPGRAGPQ